LDGMLKGRCYHCEGRVYVDVRRVDCVALAMGLDGRWVVRGSRRIFESWWGCFGGFRRAR
jgi:hypothetical protein